ncbi:hypothetical protein IFM89_008632, partial [Coptis chinensis]
YMLKEQDAYDAEMEHTFIAIKPDGVQRGLERPFFSGLCDFLSSGPVLAMVWEGEGVIKYGRKLIGATDP